MSLAFADPNPFLIASAASVTETGAGSGDGSGSGGTDGSGESLGFIGDAAVGLMEVLGAPGAGLAVFAENLFPPIPSEVILPLAGFAASRGDLNLVAAIVFCTLGSVLGALTLYGLGAWLGRERMRAIARRLPLDDVHDVDRPEERFQRHGPKAVFGRMRKHRRGETDEARREARE